MELASRLVRSIVVTVRSDSVIYFAGECLRNAGRSLRVFVGETTQNVEIKYVGGRSGDEVVSGRFFTFLIIKKPFFHTCRDRFVWNVFVDAIEINTYRIAPVPLWETIVQNVVPWHCKHNW